MNVIKQLGALRALSNRDYRLFFFGQGVSLIGTWMQNIASSWLMYSLTSSPLMLGMNGFLMQMPIFLLSPFAGVLGDRVSRHRILMIVQTCAMLQAFTFAAITLTGTVHEYHILILSSILGIISAFEMPVRQAFIVEIVKNRTDLPNAIALNSAIFNASRLIGPALAGIIVALAGEGVCFLVNGLSYLAVIGAFLMMKVSRGSKIRNNRRFISEMREGFRYALTHIPIRDLLILIAAMSFFGMSFPVLLPVFAVNIFKGGSHTYGLLVAASGGGAFLSTIFLASRKSLRGQGRVMSGALVSFSLSLILFSVSKYFYFSLIMLTAAGFSMITVVASCNMVIQSLVDEDKRGRVMSFYIMSFTGAAPAGSLVAGSVSAVLGAPVTIFVCGLACLAIAVFFSFRLTHVNDRLEEIA